MPVYMIPQYWQIVTFDTQQKFLYKLAQPSYAQVWFYGIVQRLFMQKAASFFKRGSGHWIRKKISLSTFARLTCPSPLVVSGIWIRKFLILSNYGHTQLNPPHPVRSAQLNSWWQSQYYGGGTHGNTLCCNFFIFIFFTCIFPLLRWLSRAFFDWWSLRQYFFFFFFFLSPFWYFIQNDSFTLNQYGPLQHSQS